MQGRKPVTVSLGEVLWDVLPSGKVLGGAPTNAAWHAAQLGADAHVVSAVGDDYLGREILARLAGMRLDIENVVTVADRPTSTVEATVGPDGNARYVIHENVAWDHLPATPAMLALAARAEAMNFGSLGQRSPAGRESTRALLRAARPGSVRVFDINLRPPFVFEAVIRGGLELATVVKMNDEELPLLAGMFGWSAVPERAIEELLAAHPNLRHAVVTRGPRGAWWHDRSRLVSKSPGTPVRVVDTIGAGDSVTAATMMGLLAGWEPGDILERALAIASFVCGGRGGTPELPAELKEPFLRG